MNGPWHYVEAERLLNEATVTDDEHSRWFVADDHCNALVAGAQVHATLALAAAAARPDNSTAFDAEWAQVIGP